jgi:L-rhamnose mutarotase
MLRPECVEAYRACHREVWPELEDLYRSCGVVELSCFLRGRELLVYLEVEEVAFKAARATLSTHPVEVRWQAAMRKFNAAQSSEDEFGEVYRLPEKMLADPYKI